MPRLGRGQPGLPQWHGVKNCRSNFTSSTRSTRTSAFRCPWINIALLHAVLVSNFAVSRLRRTSPRCEVLFSSWIPSPIPVEFQLPPLPSPPIPPPPSYRLFRAPPRAATTSPGASRRGWPTTLSRTCVRPSARGPFASRFAGHQHAVRAVFPSNPPQFPGDQGFLLQWSPRLGFLHGHLGVVPRPSLLLYKYLYSYWWGW